MGILNKLTQQGSVLTPYDGKTPKVNPLATKQSKLHADGNQAGYSLDGSNASIVSNDNPISRLRFQMVLHQNHQIFF